MKSLKKETKVTLQAYMPYSYVSDSFLLHRGNMYMLKEQIRSWFNRQLREEP